MITETAPQPSTPTSPTPAPAAPAATAPTTTTTTTTAPATDPLINGAPAEWKEYVPDTTKTAEENAALKTAHDATKPAPKTAEPPAPITAEAIKLPEGLIVADETMTKFLGLMNDAAMTPAQRAQALIDLQYEVAKEASEKASSAWDELQTKWQEEVQKDPEVGGAKLQASLDAANRLVRQYGSEELKAALGTTGIGNNVHFVRWLVKMAPFLTEAEIPPGGTPPSVNDKPTSTNLYPNQGKVRS